MAGIVLLLVVLLVLYVSVYSIYRKGFYHVKSPFHYI